MEMARIFGVFLIGLLLATVPIIEAERFDSSVKDNSQWGGDTYINSWAVKIPGGPVTAEIAALRNGFSDIGLVRAEKFITSAI